MLIKDFVLYRFLIYSIFFMLCVRILSGCSTEESEKNMQNPQSLISSLIPIVKKTSFSGKLISFGGDWTIPQDKDRAELPALNSLREGLQLLVNAGKIHLTDHASQQIEFLVRPGSIDVEKGVNWPQLIGNAKKQVKPEDADKDMSHVFGQQSNARNDQLVDKNLGSVSQDAWGK